MGLYASGYLCGRVVFLNNRTLVCVNAPLPSVTDVAVPVYVGQPSVGGSGGFLIVSPPLVSFSVTPRVTSISGCVMVGGTATECHPQQTVSAHSAAASPLLALAQALLTAFSALLCA